MAKISTYPSADNPLLLSDRLIGTEAPRIPASLTPLATKNFSLGELLQLFSSNFPAASLQEVLNTNNTATQDIFLTGRIETTVIKPVDIEDTLGSVGNTFQYLSKGASSINWVDLPVDGLQAVLNSQNAATQDITLAGNITSTVITPNDIRDYSLSTGTTGQFLTKAPVGLAWANLPAPAVPTLGDVLFIGNTAINDINLTGDVNATNFIKSGGTSSQFLKADGSVDATSYTPQSRTLTINGTTYDLSADRSWTVSGGGSGDIEIGTTEITSGVEGRILFEGVGNVVQQSANIAAGTTGHLLLGGIADDGVNALQVQGGTAMVGDLNIVGAAYADGAMGSNPLQLATKEYVDNSVTAGLHVHAPVRVEAETNLVATYTDGGTTPVITAIANNRVLTSVGHSLIENDLIVFTSSANGIVAGDTYFVFEVLSADTFNISHTLNGPAITTFVNGTGLSIGSRANAGVGATLVNAGAQAALVIGTIPLVVNDRVLVTGQTSAFQNGVYAVTNTGSPSTNWILTRATDADKYGIVDPNRLGEGDYFFVTEGNPGAGRSYVLSTSTEIVFGTTNIIFNEFSAAPSYSGVAPINVNGQIISISQATTATNGYLSSADWNTFNNKQDALGFTPYNATNPSNFISRTGISSSATGLTYTNTTGVFSLTGGYVIPTTTEQTNWNTAYNNRITSLTTTGSSGASTLLSNVLNVPNYTLAGLGGQPLATNLTSLSALLFVSTSFVKMTAAGTFSLDSNTYITGNQSITLSGDITGTGTTAITTAIGTNKITNTMLAQVPTSTFHGRVTAATGNVENLTGTQATTLLNVFTTSLKGLAPASGGGTTNFLRADGTWAAPSGGSGTVTSVSVVSANGLAGTVATATTTPAITLSTTVTGLLKGNGTAISAAVAGTDYLTANQSISFTPNVGGDVTGSASGATSLTPTLSIGANKVTNAMLAQVPTATIHGRITGSTGNVENLTGTQATTLLDVFSSTLKGLAPASGGGTTNFLRADGTWAAPGGGGGGTPGGNVNEVQFNNGSGGFSGAANVEISNVGNLNLIATTDPATPAADTLTMYSKTVAGRTVPKVKGPSGLDYALQASFWQNAIYMWTQTNVTNGIWMGTTGAGSGTFANTNPTAAGTIYTVQKRARYSSVVNTANQILGQRNNEVLFFRGSAADRGGFFFYARCGFDTWTNGGRFFAGMSALTTGAVVSTDPSTNNNTAGFCVDAADNGAISFLTRGTAATKQATGLTITTGKGYDVFIFCKPNDTAVHYRIVDLITGTEYSNTATLNLPTNTTLLTANVLASNAAVTPANSIQLGVVKIYIETDY
jgi:hypothetical protein